MIELPEGQVTPLTPYGDLINQLWLGRIDAPSSEQWPTGLVLVRGRGILCYVGSADAAALRGVSYALGRESRQVTPPIRPLELQGGEL